MPESGLSLVLEDLLPRGGGNKIEGTKVKMYIKLTSRTNLQKSTHTPLY